MNLATQTRNDSFVRLPRPSTKRRRYLDLVAKITREGYRWGCGTMVFDVTDMEAARILRWERTSVNGRRSELMNTKHAKPDIQDSPLVVESRKRACMITGENVTAFRSSYLSDLFSAA